MANIAWDAAEAQINQFTAQELYMGFKKEEIKPTFLTDMLVNQPSMYHKTKQFQFDTKNEKTSAPLYCTPRSSTTLVKFGGFERHIAETPYINEGFEITLDEIDECIEGFDPYTWNKLGINERLVMITRSKSRQMKKRLENIHEIQLAQQLQLGKVPVYGADVELEVDIRLPASHKVTLTGDVRWDQALSDGTKIAQIQSVWKQIADSTGGRATDMIMDGATADFLQKDTEYMERMNYRHTNVGDWDPTLLDNGEFITYMGNLRLNNGATIKLWIYDDVYRLNDGTETRYVAENTYILFNRNMPARKHWGRINNIRAAQAGMAQSEIYSYISVDKDGKYMRQVFETAPITLVEDATSFAVVTVA
jgi:hypothetical protein